MRLLKQGKPRAGVAYRVEIDGRTFQGAADGAGKFTVPIPGNARHGKLYVGNPADEEEYDLNLGGLDPIEACTGLQARLKNLGFGCDITGELDEDTRAAIRSFQIENNLKVTGEPDQQLRDLVKQKHGS
jgi:peptidoglycan hydrolase-like protein with peptidoglycan-binding domain